MLFLTLIDARIVEQIELTTPPFDGISQVRFSPTNPSHLLVASWDTVSLLYYTDRRVRSVSGSNISDLSLFTRHLRVVWLVPMYGDCLF